MNKINDLISVIVPIYDVEQYLNQCVESIVQQTHKNLEIILVDDGSPDLCGLLCDEWARKDARIKVIHKENGGLSDARNAGMAVAKGNYIGFVDSDDWIENNMYEIMLRTLLDTNADFCACGIIDSYSNKNIVRPIIPHIGVSKDFLRMLYDNTIFPVSSCNKLYRKEILNNFSFPKGKICEDAFTTYLLIDRAKKITQIQTPLYHYRIRDNSIMTAAFRPARMDEEEAWRTNYIYMQQHYPDIANSAYDFYLQKVHVLIKTIKPEQISQFKNFYNRLLKILIDNILYIIQKSKLPLKYKLYYLKDLFTLFLYKYKKF